MTDSFQAHKDDNAIIELCWPLSQARDVRSALVNKLYCTDVYCEWMSCLHDQATPVPQRDTLPIGGGRRCLQIWDGMF